MGISKGLNDYELDQLLERLKISKKSATFMQMLKSGMDFDVFETDLDMKTLEEFKLELKRGKVKTKIPNEQSAEELDSTLDDFDPIQCRLPELGDVITYEPKSIAKARKVEAYKSTITGKTDSDKTTDKGLNTSDFVVVSLKNEDGERFDLVVDRTGKDVGKIVYDEKGKPSFEMAPELKDKLEQVLVMGNAQTFISPKVIDDEIYLKDINNFLRAIEEGKFDSITLRDMTIDDALVKDIGKRAVAAQKIASRTYTKEDAALAVSLTPEEQDKEKDIDDEATRMAEENEGEELSIPEENQGEIKKVCADNDISMDSITSVLIIKDPRQIANFTENSHINPNGNEVSVIQFSSATGKEKYILIQDGNKLGGDEHDAAIRDLVAPLKMTTGVVDRVKDNENYVIYGEEKVHIQGYPEEISKNRKEEFKVKFEELVDALENAKAAGDDKYIDVIENKIYDLCVEYQVYPDARIVDDAETTKPTEDETTYDEIGRRHSPYDRRN